MLTTWLAVCLSYWKPVESYKCDPVAVVLVHLLTYKYFLCMLLREKMLKQNTDNCNEMYKILHMVCQHSRMAIMLQKIHLWYDTRCYFNVRSKADTSQLNLPHGNQQLKSGKQKNYKIKKQICSEVSVNSPGNPCSQSWRRKEKLWQKGFTEKEGFKPGIKEWEGDGILSMNDSSMRTV